MWPDGQILKKWLTPNYNEYFYRLSKLYYVEISKNNDVIEGTTMVTLLDSGEYFTT